MHEEADDHVFNTGHTVNVVLTRHGEGTATQYLSVTWTCADCDRRSDYVIDFTFSASR